MSDKTTVETFVGKSEVGEEFRARVERESEEEMGHGRMETERSTLPHILFGPVDESAYPHTVKGSTKKENVVLFDEDEPANSTEAMSDEVTLSSK